MNKKTFPWIALGIGLMLALILLVGTSGQAQEKNSIPLLALMIMNEFGFFMTAAGAYFGIRLIQGSERKIMTTSIVVANILLSLCFLWLGILLWPDAN